MANEINEQRARDALAFEPLPPSPWIKLCEQGIIIKVRYSEALSALLRSIPGRTWVPEDSHWLFPFQAADDIRKKLPRIDELAEAAKLRSDEETAARERRRVEAQQKKEDREISRGGGSILLLRPEFLYPMAGAPLHHLEAESIGHDQTRQVLIGAKRRAWVAQILGIDERGKWIRAFLDGRTDYARSNSTGSRGVYINFSLREGPIYEVAAPQSWKSTDRTFVRYVDGLKTKMAEAEVRKCLSNSA